MPDSRTMKAAVHTDALKLEIQEKEVPQVTDYDHVLLKVGAVGICGSDKHDLETAPLRPQTPGHEFTGVIEELGSEPGEFRVGDRVLVKAGARCGVCAGCKLKPRGKCEKPGVYGCRGIQHPPGAMAEYVLVRTENLTKIPDDVSFEEAALVDPLAVAIFGIEMGPDVKGQNCVVMGAGAIGLLLGMALKIHGANRVAMVDIMPSHLETAKKLGDFECYLSDDRDKLVPQLQDLNSSIYYELAGGEAPTIDIAIQCINKGGWILCISQRPKGVWLNYQYVMFKGLTLRGVPGISDTSWDEAVDLIWNHKIDVKPVITHRYPLAQAEEALHMAVKGDSLKVIINPNKDLA